MTEKLKEKTILGLGLSSDTEDWYIPVGHKPYMGMEQKNLFVPKDLFKGFTGPITAHNTKEDFKVLVQAGIEVPTDNLWCTMMLSVYIDENVIPGHDLDTVLKEYTGERKMTIEKKSLIEFGWEQSPIEYMARYCLQDTAPLKPLRRKLLEKCKPQWIQLWEQIDREFMLLLAKIELRGVRIDREKCAEFEAQCQFRLREIQEELGFDPAKPTQLHPKLFSDPPEGLGLTVPSWTPGGKKPSKKTGKLSPPKPQVRLEWLESVGHPVTALVHEHSKTAKQLSSYFSAYLNLTTRDYDRLHPNFKQHGTVTGRTSCEQPNLQQIPREEWKDANVKKLFLPETGKELWEADYRTIEYRLAAVYAQCGRLIRLFEEEGDFHQLVADDISRSTGRTLSRQSAKTVNYLMGYGGGIPVLRSKLGVSYSTAQKIHTAYKASYPEIFDKSDEASEYAESNDGEIDMWSGRTRHFTWESEYHKAFNSVIQGGAFEIVKRSMLLLDKAGFDICLQVHDSVWLNADNEKEVIEAQKVMEDWTKDQFGLTFRTDIKRLN